MGDDGEAQPHGNGSEPITERTALLGDRHSQEPSPIAIPRGANGKSVIADDGSGSGSGSENDLDPNESDLLVARSFTSGASGLAPESFESAMLRGRRRSRSTMRRRPSIARSVTSPPPRPTLDEQQPDDSLSNVVSDDEADLEAADVQLRPAYLIDTDKKRFGIVFLSIMLTHFIACFDGTIGMYKKAFRIIIFKIFDL